MFLLDVDFSDMSSTGQITTKVLPTVKLLKDVEPVANLKALKETDESIKSLTSAGELISSIFVHLKNMLEW